MNVFNLSCTAAFSMQPECSDFAPHHVSGQLTVTFSKNIYLVIPHQIISETSPTQSPQFIIIIARVLEVSRRAALHAPASAVCCKYQELIL
jgi:hypothetical protein